MNCFCHQLAIIKKVNDESKKNYGREFFTCQTKKCEFFHFTDSNYPPPLHPKANAMRQNESTSSSNPKNLPIAKFHLHSFSANYGVDGVTLTLFCSSSPGLTNFMQSLQQKSSIGSSPFIAFDTGLKMWMFDMSFYDRIVMGLKELNFFVEELPRFLIDGIQKYRHKLSNPRALSSSSSSSSSSSLTFFDEAKIENLNISESLLSKLMPFQLEGIQFIISHGGRGLIGDEMGCGKTIQAIGLLQHYRSQWPALVILPPNLLHQWYEELTRFTPTSILDPSKDDITLIKQGKDLIKKETKIVLISYSIIDKFIESSKITPAQFGMIIIDESHKLKNKESKCCNNILPFLKNISIAILLSGTPAINRPVELFTQVSGILPNMFKEYDSFVKRYCNAKQSRFGDFLDVNGSSNESELKLLLENMIMIRRLKNDVITQLPDKSRQPVYVDCDPAYMPELVGIQKRMQYLEISIKNQQSTSSYSSSKNSSSLLLTAGDDNGNGPMDDMKKLKNEKERLLLEYHRITGTAKIPGLKNELLRLIEIKHLEKAMNEMTEDEEDFSENKPNDKVLLEIQNDVIVLDDDDNEEKMDVKVEARCHELDYIFTDKPFNDESEDQSVDSDYSDIWKKQTNKRKNGKKGSSAETDRKGKKKRKTVVEIEKPKEEEKQVGSKILVFAHHQVILDSLEDMLRQKNIKHIRVDGRTTQSRKAVLIDQFQTDNEVLMFRLPLE
jgi:SNF2 family DNA or RNA helicase